MSLRRNLSKYLALYSYVEAYRSNKLPEGYTKLSYIQGDGNAYIDLGIVLTQDDAIEIDFVARYTTSAQIFGYRNSASSNNIMLFTGGNPNSIFLDFNNSNYADYRLSATSTDGSEYKAILNKNVRQLLDSNGDVIVENTTTCSDTITTGNVCLFFAGGTPSGSNKFTGSIKKVIISDRMDLIPCKDPNNNVGMYDIISGKFFGNVAGVGAFVAGDEIADDYFGFNTVKLKDAIHGKLNELTVYGKTKNKSVDGLDSLIANGGTELIPETYLDTVIAKGKCVQENRLTNGLPSEYQELYYIESDGSAYIDTGYIPNNETKVECVVDRPIAPANGYVWYPFTTENDPTNGQFAVFESTNSGGDKYTALTWGKTATSEVLTGATTAYSKSLFVLQNGILTYDNNTKTITSPNAGQTFSCTKPITLFKRLNTTSNFVSVRMYSFKLYQSNALVMNLLPVRRKADGEVGMYDTVSKTFLTNQDTGTFTASEDKLIDSTSSDYTILDYVTFDGTQVIDTGVICNEESRIESKWIANSSSMWVYGTGTTNPRITCYCVSSGNERFGDVTVDSTGITHNVLNTLTHDKNGFYYNGTNGKPYSNVGTFTCLDTLTIGNSNGSTGTPLFAGNFYYMRIYDNNVLIRSYIPVKRNSDDVVGFFDTVSSTFITPFEGNALVAGTVKTTWEPTPNFPVDIWCNNGALRVDANGDVYADGTKETLQLTGKNLFNWHIGLQLGTDPTVIWTLESGGVTFALNQATGLYAVSGLATGTGGRNTLRTQTFYLPAGTYTISATNSPVINILLVNETTGNTIAQTQSTTTFTLTETTPLHFGLSRTPGITYNDSFYLQIEQGSTATDYQPYTGDTATCEDLLSIGDYTDEQEIISGVVTRKLGVKVLDGTETGWSMGSTSFYISNLVPDAIGYSEDNPASIFSHFQGVQPKVSIADMPDGSAKLGASSQQRRLYFKNSDITSVSDWTDWLADQYAAGTPVMIIYPLATPITETTSSANLKKKEVSVISGSLSISDLEVTSTESEHTVPTPLRPLSLRCNNGILSTDFKDEYMTLEYLESSGAQYIDLGRVPNNNDIIEQKFQKKGSDTTTCSWYGSMPSSQTILPRIGIGSFKASGTASASIFAGANYTGYTGPLGEPMDTNPHILRFQATGQTELTYTYDGVTFVIDASGATTPANFYEPAVELTSYLFARHGSNGVQTYDNEGTRIYYHKEYLADGTLVMNLIPVKRKFDNVVGMYDTVSQTFFTNAGTGDLIAGPATVNVKGTQETVITVKETNLFDKDTCDYINAYVNANTGVLTQGSPGSSTQYCFVIPCKSNTTYKLDGMGANLSAWGSFTDNTIGTTATVYVKGNNTLTTGSNDHYLIGLAYTTGTAIYDYRDTLDIREIDIMAYVENLLAIDSTYVDTQDILTGIITRKIGIWVVDGTEPWAATAQTYGLGIPQTTIPFQIGGAVMCSHFPYAASVTTDDTNVIANTTGNYGLRILFNGDIIDSSADSTTRAAQGKAWLADQYAKGTPVIIVYPLATATTETVSAQEMRNSPASIKDASMEGLTLTQTHSIHATPTPAFPLDLVCNNGVIKGVSKNLFDPAESNIVCGYWLKNTNGQPEASAANFYTDMYMPVKPDTSYVAFGRKKSDNTLSNWNRIAWYDSSKTWIRNSTYTQGTIGIDTSPSNAAYARFHCNIDGSTLTTDYVLEWNWMLYEGTEEESFVPYGVITEGNPEVLKVKGKNLFDISSVQILPNKAISDTGTYVDNPKVNICDTYIHVKPNTTYTISGNTLSGTVDTGTPVYFRLAYYDSNKTFISRSEGVEGIYYTFTTDSNVNYIKFHYANSTADLNTYVLEEGIRPTRYEEYMDMNYLMPTLLSAGDFADTQELQSGIYNGEIGVKVFDGTENWQNISGYMNISKTDLGSNSTVMPSNSHNIICSHFETKDGTFTDGIGIGGNYVNVKYDSLFTTLAEWQQYLADQYAKGTPVIIVYPLANTSIKTEESKNIYIDAGTNEISRISDIDELEMEVKYKKLK